MSAPNLVATGAAPSAPNSTSRYPPSSATHPFARSVDPRSARPPRSLTPTMIHKPRPFATPIHPYTGLHNPPRSSALPQHNTRHTHLPSRTSPDTPDLGTAASHLRARNGAVCGRRAWTTRRRAPSRAPLVGGASRAGGVAAPERLGADLDVAAHHDPPRRTCVDQARIRPRVDPHLRRSGMPTTAARWAPASIRRVLDRGSIHTCVDQARTRPRLDPYLRRSGAYPAAARPALRRSGAHPPAVRPTPAPIKPRVAFPSGIGRPSSASRPLK